jgi:hypothetical protein
MPKKLMETNPFSGRWHIVSMAVWSSDAINAERQGFIEFDEKFRGDFQFCYVTGRIKCRLTKREGEPVIDWTWKGMDEMDPAHGTGWAALKGDELHGEIAIERGDKSSFVAKKADSSGLTLSGARTESVRKPVIVKEPTRLFPKRQPVIVQKVVLGAFPAIAKWVEGYGHIEIGDQEGFGFIVRAIDYGGQVFEDSKPSTLAEAMAALEQGILDWFKGQGIELH